ncbi:insulin gene enhancer protein ISL-1 [Galendromus occidentalis]|uniref:Insulin gene enhancer protein ISL-1 n=1 Tax=Galendromus occidentalis TaxID=34638 RepID=A0AAJ7PA04_9ACAR|nr:insulin gene enhancer protein ISL-1 [Galendromus occidentalis]
MQERRCGNGISLCVGCGSQIQDQYILRVSPDLEWHASCLKCVECLQFLDESCTCFVREGKTYCKSDYHRLFGAKCSKCGLSFSRSDFVMRARGKIFHIDCFRCIACSRQLIPGDEFAIREDELFCKADHDVLGVADAVPSVGPRGNGLPSLGGNGAGGGGGGPGGGGGGGSAGGGSVRSQGHKGGRGGEHKPTRVRTVLNEKQLHTLRTCYAANPRPDALMKEQLVEMTGLSPRVIRVWFQNKRCKDKKRSIMMKQMQQSEKDGRQLSLGALRGVPMVATSPVRHEPGQGQLSQALDIQAYQAPWKTLSEYAISHPDSDLDPNSPQFRQLVNQMHGYDPSGPVAMPLEPSHTYLGGLDDSNCQMPPRSPSEMSSAASD